jgi:hypothetical protein
MELHVGVPPPTVQELQGVPVMRCVTCYMLFGNSNMELNFSSLRVFHIKHIQSLMLLCADHKLMKMQVTGV